MAIPIDWWLMIVVDHALDSVFELDDVKVDQQSDLDIQQSEMRQQLREVHRVECFFTLDLNYDHAVDDKISAKAAFQFHFCID